MDRRQISVVIVDDHAVFRDGLRALLEAQPWIAAVVDAADSPAALRAVRAAPPDVIVADVFLSGRSTLRMSGITDPDNGVALVRTIAEQAPQVRALVLTYTNEPRVAQAALNAGAAGILHKDSDPDTIVAAVRLVADGGTVLAPGLGTGLQLPNADLPGPLASLTPRETHLLAGAAMGLSNSQIGRRLGVSVKTVSNQLSQLITKLGVRDRAHLASLATRYGIGVEHLPDASDGRMG